MGEKSMEILSETEDFSVWRIEEDGEWTFHLEMGAATCHFFQDEWEQFLALMDPLCAG